MLEGGWAFNWVGCYCTSIHGNIDLGLNPNSGQRLLEAIIYRRADRHLSSWFLS